MFENIDFGIYLKLNSIFYQEGDCGMRKSNSINMIMAAIVAMGVCGTLMASQTTDKIESSAKKSYVFKTYLKGDNIKVHALSDSVVSLTGIVSEWSHRSLAEETVAGLPGVLRVENKLEVKGEQWPENSDAWIGIKVKTALMFHRNVSGANTNVEVKDGVVSLSGKASSDAQKELTTEYVKDIEGVQSVKNDIFVKKEGKTTVEKVSDYIDDASITAQVRLALLFHHSTNVIKTKVETKDGIVTVSGVAKNGAERDLVSKLVSDIKGVKEVKNDITI
jgi:hyperosmotically inducible periplasmic protein